MAAAAVGAVSGPWLIRRALDSWNRVVFAMMLGLFALPLAALSTAMCASAAVYPAGVPVAVIWFSATCGVVLLSSVVLIATSVLARWWWRSRRDRGPVLLPAPSGCPAIAYPRSAISLVPTLAMAVTLALTGCLLATSAAVHGDLLGASIFGALGLAGLLVLVPFGRGEVSVGGLYLTSAGIEHRAGTVTVHAPWDSLAWPRHYLAEPVDLTAPRLGSTLSLARGPGFERSVSTRWPIPVDPADRDGADDWKLPTAFLPVTSGRLLQEVTQYAVGDASSRQLIGAPGSLFGRSPADG